MSLLARWPVMSTYRVEVSGWDTSRSFFVEKAELEWNDEGWKHVALGRELKDGAIVFVRLLQPMSPDRSHPVPYEIRNVAKTDERKWQFRLRQVQPRASQTENVAG
jgi:hypothetical protein